LVCVNTFFLSKNQIILLRLVYHKLPIFPNKLRNEKIRRPKSYIKCGAVRLDYELFFIFLSFKTIDPIVSRSK